MGVDAALHHGQAGEVYNFGGRSERYNLDVTRSVLKLTGKSDNLIQHVTDRLGHDRRYAVNCDKAEAELGWTQTTSFERGLAETVDWYRTHTTWVQRVRAGAYRNLGGIGTRSGVSGSSCE
jgi:dTDP-glucose 4,6-dehydratase